MSPVTLEQQPSLVYDPSVPPPSYHPPYNTVLQQVDSRFIQGKPRMAFFAEIHLDIQFNLLEIFEYLSNPRSNPPDPYHTYMPSSYWYGGNYSSPWGHCGPPVICSFCFLWYQNCSHSCFLPIFVLLFVL